MDPIGEEVLLLEMNETSEEAVTTKFTQHTRNFSLVTSLHDEKGVDALRAHHSIFCFRREEDSIETETLFFSPERKTRDCLSRCLWVRNHSSYTLQSPN